MFINLPYTSFHDNKLVSEYFERVNGTTQGKLNKIVQFFEDTINPKEFESTSSVEHPCLLDINAENESLFSKYSKIESDICTKSFANALKNSPECEKSYIALKKFKAENIENLQVRFKAALEFRQAEECKEFRNNYQATTECVEAETVVRNIVDNFEFQAKCGIKDGNLAVELNSDSIVYRLYKKAESLFGGKTITTQELKCNFVNENLECQEGPINKVTEEFKFFGRSEYSNSEISNIGLFLFFSGMLSALAYVNHRALKSNKDLSEKQITELKDTRTASGIVALICLVAAGGFAALRT